MDPSRLLQGVKDAGDAIVDAARRGPDAAIPSCPEWHMPDLLAHVADMTAHHLRREDRADVDADGFAAMHADLMAAFDAAAAAGWAPSEPCPWLGPAQVRHHAHELGVHRWDAQNAVGTADPIDADLAASGLEEFLELLPQYWSHDGSGESLHIHATDADAEWLLRCEPSGLRCERGHAKADVALRGGASDLHLFLWGRVPRDRLDVIGDLESFPLFRG
jgi:uncharacterized protein (TIGR03083 family)